MSGNAAEWVWDWYPCPNKKKCDDPYPAWKKSGYRGLDTGTERVIRGGHVKDVRMKLRRSARFMGDPQKKMKYTGFRIVY